MMAILGCQLDYIWNYKIQMSGYTFKEFFFLFSFFETVFLCVALAIPVWTTQPSNSGPPVSASQVLGIKGVHHYFPPISKSNTIDS